MPRVSTKKFRTYDEYNALMIQLSQELSALYIDCKYKEAKVLLRTIHNLITEGENFHRRMRATTITKAITERRTKQKNKEKDIDKTE